MARTLADDVTAMVTGFGSVLVLAVGGSTRGLWADAEVEIDAGRHSVLTAHRVLLVGTADVATLTIARESTVEIGEVDDDTTLTSYRVVDSRKESDGLLTRLVVVPS